MNNLYIRDEKYSELFKSLPDYSREDQMFVLRELCLNDLYFFSKYILDYWFLCPDPHMELCREIEKDENLTLILYPRGHCKSTTFGIAHTIQSYLKAPHEPIAIVCDQGRRAKKKLRPIKYQFENNKSLLELFPDLVFDNPKKESAKWTDEELILPGYQGGQEASISCYGLDSQPTGSHFPRIKCDDIVTPETVTTMEQIKKNHEFYGLLRSSILTPNGNIQICGTIYDDADLHRTMEESGEYRIVKKPAEEDIKLSGGGTVKKYLWPVQYGRNKLEKIKSDPTVGIYLYSCQYLLDPAPADEDAFFQESWFPEYEKAPHRLNVFAAADLAISEKETACDTAIVVAGADYEHNLYILEVLAGRWDSLKIIDNIIHVQRKYKPGTFSIEAENIARTIKPFLSLKMRETGTFINAEYVTPVGQGDKVARAKPLQGRSKEGAIYLPAKKFKLEWAKETRFQLRRFPRGKKKDIVDSMALLCQKIDEQWTPKQKPNFWYGQNDRYVSLQGTGY